MATKISWATETWNPITGCSPVSEGCANCYAARMAKRLAGRYGYPEIEPFAVTFHDELSKPHQWKRPRMVFVCSMGDIFHPDVQDEWIARALNVINDCHWHKFLILTKRPERMEAFFKEFYAKMEHSCMRVETPIKNLWLGTTAENQEQAEKRLPHLLRTPAVKRFVSCEPLLGPVDLEGVQFEHSHGFFGNALRWTHLPDCRRKELQNGAVYPKLDWVIAGGETGPGARPMHPEWVRSLRDQCVNADVPFHFKSWGEFGTISKNLSTNEPVFRMFPDLQTWVNKGSTWVNGGICVDMAGMVLRNGGDFRQAEYPVAILHKIGKNKAGRIVDGQEWDQFPELLK